MTQPFTTLHVTGPYREPLRPALSYDFVVQRPTWPTPQMVRVQVDLAEELDYVKSKMLEVHGGRPGQQLLVNQMLPRRLAERMLQIGNEEGLFLERKDIVIGPFAGPLAHLFLQLESWARDNQQILREEIRQRTRL